MSKSIDSKPFVAVVYGPRGGKPKFYVGDTEGAVAGPALRYWLKLQEKFMKKDTGEPPLYECYNRMRTTATVVETSAFRSLGIPTIPIGVKLTRSADHKHVPGELPFGVTVVDGFDKAILVANASPEKKGAKTGKVLKSTRRSPKKN